MKKLSTFFKKNPENLGRVINEIDPKNEWVLNEGIPTRKFDGTACAIIKGELYKRYDVKINKKTGKRKQVPDGAIPCQEPDEKSGHWPHWVKCQRDDPNNKYHFEAFDMEQNIKDGTYELCGPKIQGNPEKLDKHKLIRHGILLVSEIYDYSFSHIKKYLECYDIEGIVFHHKTDERMCKIRKSDFGIKR